MATSFKTFTNKDSVSTRTLLHESIPLTGSIVSGTYAEGATSTSNIRNYSHGMFQSVYDYPYLSSSANQIFDMTVGYHSSSALQATTNIDNDSKINIYNQMAQILMGHDITGSIRLFDNDGDLSAGGSKMTECFFISFARLLSKDEIKKGSFKLEMGVTGTSLITAGDSWGYLADGNPFKGRIQITDSHATTDYRVNSPAGEYAILKLNGTHTDSPLIGAATSASATGSNCGLIFYQAGIVVLTSSIFLSGGIGGIGRGMLSGNVNMDAGSASIEGILTGSLSGAVDGFRHYFYDCSFNNTTELNSSVYYCRANHNEFNYSANPTYITGSKIRVKENSLDPPVSYVTSIGMYSADNELLAVAKLSEPLKKDPNTEFTLRVRLDY